jgi:hypothetical protein
MSTPFLAQRKFAPSSFVLISAQDSNAHSCFYLLFFVRAKCES